MKIIYIIKNVGGEYDDRTERSLCAVTTKEKAEILVGQFSDLNAFNCAFNERIHNEFLPAWKEKNPPQGDRPVRPRPPEGFHDLQLKITEKKSEISFLDNTIDSISITLRETKTKELENLKKSFAVLQDQHHESLVTFKEAETEWYSLNDAYNERMRTDQGRWFIANYSIPGHMTKVAEIAAEQQHLAYPENEYSFYKLSVVE